MDRGRESRRGGGGSGSVSGHASSRRRPRSTFKDSSVCEEEDGLNESHDSTRLRERSSSNNNNNSNKKERSSLSSSRNKRKRPGLTERFHGSSRDRDRDRDRDNDEGDESSEESAGEEEEEEDDEPPPHRPLPNPRRTTKFKSQWKVPDEMIAVALVVPRKARSASVKRPHDSSSQAVSVGTADGSAHRRQKSPSPARPSVVPPSPSSSNVSAKPGRRMKPIGTKPRPSKMAKVCNSISESEVEVAEVLFGLTRQFQNHHSAVEIYANANANVNANASKPDARECSNDGSVPLFSKVSSPLPTSSVVSSPISTSISPPSSSPALALALPQHYASAPAPPTAPKKKRPRPTKPEETGPTISMRPPVPVSSPSPMPSVTSATRHDTETGYQAAKMEVSSLKSEADAVFPVGLSKGIPSATTTTCASSSPKQVSTPPLPPNPNDAPIASEKIACTKNTDSKSITNEKAIEAKISDLKLISEKIAESKLPDSKTIPFDEARGATSAELKPVPSEKTAGQEDIESNSTHLAEKRPSDVLEDSDKVVTDVSEAQADHQIAKKEIEAPDTNLPSGQDTNVQTTTMFPQSPKTENTVEEKFKIDLMALPEKSSFDTEDDSVADAVGNAVPEVPQNGLEEITNISEIKSVTVKDERQSDKREHELKVEETQEKYEKRDDGEENDLEKQDVKERSIDLQLDAENLEKDSSRSLPQKQSRISRNESRTEKAEKSVSAAAATGNVGSSASAVASMPIPMTVPAWPGPLPLGYYTPTAANWPGAPSLPGVVPLEGTNTTPAIQHPYTVQQARPTWKRCATHSYIAHFIEYQLRIARHPFWTAANYFGHRQYNLNVPMTPSSEIINLSSSISGTVSAASAGNNVSISRGLDSTQDKSIASTALAAFNSPSAKEKTSNKMDARRKQPSQQQSAQQISSTIIQHGHGFSFSTPQCGAVGANPGIAGTTGNAGSSLNGGSVAVGAVPSAGSGPPNSNIASISADAQYMAMLQQYPFAINPHFGATYNGTANHIGQQAAQFFNAPFYATQLLQPPQPQPQPQPQSQQQGTQNPSTSSGSSSSQQHKQKFQGSRNFPSSQKQQQQGTPSPSPSNSQQHHHLLSSQARHIDREANNGGDSPSTADSRLPVLQKTFYSPASPSNSNFSGPVQAQDLAVMAAYGGKHNGKQQQQPPPQIQHQVAAGYTIQQHHGNDPTFQMSLKALEPLSQSQAIAALSRNAGVLCVSPTMLQGMPESARHQMAAQAQQNAIQPGLQPQRSGQMPRSQTPIAGDGRNIVDSMSTAGAGGRGCDEERKSSMKGGLNHSLNFSRIEAENSTNMQGSPTDGGLPTSLLANSFDNMNRILNTNPPAVNGSRNSRPTGSSSQGSPQPPSNQQFNQNTKQPVMRAKTMSNPNVPPPVSSSQSTISSYVDRDRAAVPSSNPSSNLGKFQTPLSSFPGQNLKQGQQSPQWKMDTRIAMSSTIPTAVGATSQALLATPMKIFSQQGRNQQNNTNIGQLPVNQKNNSTSTGPPKLSSSNVVSVGSVPISSSAPASKSVGTPASRSPTGSKGPVSQQKSVAPTSNKKSSPVSSRSMSSVLGPAPASQSSSGKSAQQQYQQQQHQQQQQQSMPPMASVQPVSLKNQQYHNTTHFNPQLLFPHQYLPQSQFSAKPAHQVPGFHQKQQGHGSSSPQPSFSNAHLRQQEQQQMQPSSSASSTPGTLSLGPTTLTLGGASGGPAKINPGGSLGGNSKSNTILHAQYSSQQQLGSQHLAAPYNVSSKFVEQRVVADVLAHEQINGVRMLQNSANLCMSASPNRSPFNTSPQASSVRMPPGNLRKSEGGNTAESMNNASGLCLSMSPSSGIRTNNAGLTASGNAGHHAKSTAVSSAASHSSQMPTMSIHQPPIPLPGAPNSATSTSPGLHGQTTSMVQP